MGLKLIIFSLLLNSFVFCQEYYWRPYYHEIPQDAVNATPARDVFIGVGTVFERGDYVGELFAGESSIFVSPAGGDIQYTDQQLYVLCSSNVNGLHWVPADYTVLDSIPNKIQVGYEVYYLGNVPNTLFIGRGVVDGVQRIGKILGYIPDGTNRLYIADAPTWREIWIDNYEVLVFS